MSAALKQALVQYLRGQPTVTAIVGSSPARIYPRRLPQKAARPALAYRLTSRVPTFTIDGGQGGLCRARCDIDAYGDPATDPYGTASDLSAAVEAVLVAVPGGFVGTVNYTDTATGEPRTLAVANTRLDDEADENADPQFGQDVTQDAVRQSYVIWFTEP